VILRKASWWHPQEALKRGSKSAIPRQQDTRSAEHEYHQNYRHKHDINMISSPSDRRNVMGSRKRSVLGREYSGKDNNIFKMTRAGVCRWKPLQEIFKLKTVLNIVPRNGELKAFPMRHEHLESTREGNDNFVGTECLDQASGDLKNEKGLSALMH